MATQVKDRISGIPCVHCPVCKTGIPMEEYSKWHQHDTPHWEHGWRCHGYWLHRDRVGFIGLTPPGFPVMYTWHFGTQSGTEKKLRRAKGRVEHAYRMQQLAKMGIVPKTKEAIR